MQDVQLARADALSVVESLRCGVPNRRLIPLLGTNQIEILAALGTYLDGDSEANSSGFFIEGGFGSGKSHALAVLEQAALTRNFACSLVAVSKETTLSALQGLFHAAIRSLRLPDRTGMGSCGEFIDRLNPESASFKELADQYSKNVETEPAFGVSLQLFEQYQSRPTVVESIIDFWDGERCPTTAFRNDLKEARLPYKHFRAPPETKLGRQRLDFVAALLKASGYAGWLILIDEVELVAKISLLARARAYANLASLLGCPYFMAPKGIAVVVSITDDLMYELFDVRGDAQAIERNFRFRYEALADAAKVAIPYLLAGANHFTIVRPSANEIRRILERIGAAYKRAYPDCSIPDVPDVDKVESSRTLRQFIKQWITELDLRRLYPNHEPSLTFRTVTEDISENTDYEGHDA